jgi:phosphatidylglycerophosphatase A
MSTVKESSDELNPAVAAPPSAIEPRQRRTPVDYLALAIATCGVGYLPLAPGTLGSMVGVGLYLSLWTSAYQLLEANASRRPSNLLYIFTPQLAFMLVVILVVTMAGIWAASRTERIQQKKDPSIVVIDEVAGQMIALLSGPFWIQTWWSILTAFILFRLFDIWKPYPIRRLEKLEAGLGIMADDVVAGAYALVANSILISAYLLLFPA